jgi:hypothetical protein
VEEIAAVAVLVVFVGVDVSVEMVDIGVVDVDGIDIDDVENDIAKVDDGDVEDDIVKVDDGDVEDDIAKVDDGIKGRDTVACAVEFGEHARFTHVHVVFGFVEQSCGDG